MIVAHQEINNVRGITFVVSWMNNIISSRNVDSRVCSDDVTSEISVFAHFIMKLQFMKVWGWRRSITCYRLCRVL